MSDLFFGAEEGRILHLGEFFPLSKVLAVQHNAHRIWNDIRKGTRETPRLSQPRTLRIQKLRSKRMSDILSRKESSPSFTAFIDREKIVRTNPLVLSRSVNIPENAIDVRT